MTLSHLRWLDLHLAYESSLIGPILDETQRLVAEFAPIWAKGLHSWMADEGPVPIDVREPNALSAIALEVGLRRGALFHQLGGHDGAVRYGSVEVRGAEPVMVLVLNFNDRALQRVGPRLTWANSLTLQVRGEVVRNEELPGWSLSLFRALAGATSPVYGRIASPAEFDAKNLRSDRGGIRAVGIDVSQGLPGLYWVNFLGAPYIEHIGRERVLTCPAVETVPADSGALIRIYDAPWEWSSGLEAATCARDHLGQEHFADTSGDGRDSHGPDLTSRSVYP